MSATVGPNMSKPLPNDVLQFVQQKDRPFVKTREVANRFSESCSRRTVFNRLEQLADDGELVKYKVTDSVSVWYPQEAQNSDSASKASPSSDNQ